ncbi:MAG TPA: hypothetical protein PKK48_04115 [Phycisphaerae bacterium]|mgnify:CR=1 FL=1|nr:hypothetical protein [Phycisphaerae bacterium]HPS52739.1 hypothetical protein [Phycisphaerae bacterium]
MKKAIFLLSLATTALLTGGCQSPDDDGKMQLSLYPATIQVTLPPANKKDIPDKPDYQFMSNVLAEIIVADGNIDTARFDIFKKDLIKVLQTLDAHGPSCNPKSFETPADRMAYWYNARAFWAMYLAAKYNREMKSYYLSSLENAFYSIRFPVDGRIMTLRKIDDEIFNLGGYLSLIAAPGALSGRAAIPETAFQPQNFPAIIKSRFNDFIADRRRFTIDVLNMEIFVPRIIWQFHKKIMDDYQALYPTPQATFLLALSSMTSEVARFRLKNAIGYKCVEAPARQTIMITGNNKQTF